MEDIIMDMPQSKRKDKEILTKQWSNLSLDLVDLIVRKLHFTDRNRFRAVCKDWRFQGSRPLNEVPWVMSHNLVDLILGIEPKLELYDPIQKKGHKILINRSKYSNLFYGSRICASKGGWLIFGNLKSDTRMVVFLYNPFTDSVIMLPTLSTITHYCGKATFSSTNPTSPDCIFVVSHCCEHCRLGISTCRSGDTEWKTKILDHNYGCLVISIMCTEKGICYFVFHGGKLGSFCFESQEWIWLVDSCRDLTSYRYTHLVESDGVLLVVRGFSYIYYTFFKLCRYDEDERGWVEQKSLGERALFIDNFGSYLRHASGDTSHLADKIIFNYRDMCRIRVYLLKDGKEQYEKVRPYDWIEKAHLHHGIWIEPPY